MEIIKVTTYSRDNKGNVSGEQETFFADRMKALEFIRNEGCTHGHLDEEDYPEKLDVRHFWGDEKDNTFASFDATGETGDKITRHAEVSFSTVQ